jgi:hypothetical protein
MTIPPAWKQQGGVMATRQTAVDKFDDDFYLGLPPRLKVAWDYITLHCDGTGQVKVSFQKLSNMIGESVTRDDFIERFGRRIHWISDDRIWIVGFIRFFYRKLSPANKAHRNVVAKLIRESSDWGLSPENRAYIDGLAAIFSPENMTVSSEVGSVSGEKVTFSPRLIRNEKEKENEKDLCIQEGGVGETNNPPPDCDASPAAVHVIVPEIITDEISRPILERFIPAVVQEQWVRAFVGLNLGEEIRACVLHHAAKPPDGGPPQWGLRIVNWLNEARRRALRANSWHGLGPPSKSLDDISIEELAKQKGITS